MVARPGTLQANWNAGEFSPASYGRSDIKQFYSGASEMRNCEPVPQGGFAQLAGTVEQALVRGELTPISGSLSTSLGPHAVSGVVIATFSFIQALLDAVDLNGLSANIALPAALQLQIFNAASAWENFGSPVYVRTTAQNRRVALPAGAGKLASAVRVVLVVTPGSAATFTLSSISAWRELAPGIIGRQFEYSFSISDAFTVVMTPGHADIFKEDAFVASVAHPVPAAVLAELTYEQRLDSLFLFHPDMEPVQIKRDQADTDWLSQVAPVVNVPLVDYGGVYVNIINDVWRISVSWSSGPVGLILEMAVNGENISGVELLAGPDWAGFETSLKAAIEALPSVEPGIAVSRSIGAATATFTVTFSGTGNAGNRFSVVPKIVNVTWAAATASNTQLGDPGGEAIMSALQGWPTTGLFYQDRLLIGGFKGQPNAFSGSITGEYFDFNTKVEAVSGAILVRLDTDGAERIQHMRRDRHIVIFTDQAEYYVTDRALVRGTPPNIAQSSNNGSAWNFRPVSSEGSLIYVDRSRSIVYAATYSDVSQKYESEMISALANHLCTGLLSGALQRASSSTNAARLWFTRDDGVMVCGVLIRNQDVTAFVRWQTDGQVKAITVDAKNQVYLLVMRTIGGSPRLVREKMVDGQWLHQAQYKTFGSPTKTITGLGSLEGAVVWAVADGYPEGPYTVTSGTITLVNECSTCWVGRWMPPLAATLPLPRLVSDRVQMARPVRVHTVRARLLGTTSIAIGANGGNAQDIALVRGGDVTNQPVIPVTRPIEISGLSGYSDEGIVVFTQVRPGDFRVRDVTLEART